ncbi:MAG: TolB family protein [Actinomycetota bacterium]
MRGHGGRSARPALRSVAAIATFLVLAAGCTEEAPERDLPDVVIGSVTESPVASPSSGPAGVPSDVGRLAVLDSLGNLVTIDPDGTDEVMLAEAVEGQIVVQQPTWSPDGSRVAWVRLEVGDTGVSGVLVTRRVDGTRPTEAPTAGAPFYLFWDPTSSRIAYLGSSASSQIELGIVEVADGGRAATPLDAGQPFYLSWAPSGRELLVHVGTDRLERLELDGTLATVDTRPGAFSAPVWTSDGRSLVYATETGDRQRLVTQDLEEERGRELVRFEGAITFVVSHDGSRVAFQVVAGQDDVSPLSVLDRETGAVERVATGFVPAFFWNPEGDRLLFLLPEPDPDRVWFRWGLWDGESTFGTSRFYPSLVFGRDYLSFFEQYAQSMSLWAPDGSAFAYAGYNESGEEGIWVQPAQLEREPSLVKDGVFATWSPR